MIRRAIFWLLSKLSPYRTDRESMQRRLMQAHLDNATNRSFW